MKNERGAGRKPVIDEKELNNIKIRIDKGESVSSIAKEYGVSRQALYKRLKQGISDQVFTLDYIVDGDVTTRIDVDFRNEKVSIKNFGQRISRYAFGLNQNPNWSDFLHFLEESLLGKKQLNSERSSKRLILQDSSCIDYSIEEVVKSKDSPIIVSSTSEQIEISKLPRFTFTKKDILYSRTDTDGYQLKALSRDRRFFVKSQAIISGVLMDDWAVELLASDICRQLDIPCVKQYECEFVYGDRVYKGVYSDNFELDGYTFVSFESLLERMGTSSREQEFIHLDAIDKLKWCADKLAKAGNLFYEETLKYMIDLAVIDCLVGNIDRHTRNFGLFYNTFTKRHEIPLIFDNGMGLFENDGYRDRYSSYDAAMMNVYVSPYGEDPFDMMDLLMNEWDLYTIYPKLTDLEYDSLKNTPFATEYIRRMKEKIVERRAK